MNLAYRMRPKNLEGFVGQEHLLGKGKILSAIIESGNLFPLIFWGPPGSGKTTLARILANASHANFNELTAVNAGKAELNEIIKKAKVNQENNIKTVLFIDEIHRWNKAQQDSLLPYVESSLIILIGATTENPSFEVISALLSRSKVLTLQGLTLKDLEIILERGLKELKKKIDKPAKELLIRLSGGDARIMLNALELSAQYKDINEEVVKEVFQTKSAGIYDKKADEHYNTISAFIKSVRGSNPDAALYYLCRMLNLGEDPKFIARRLIILASEDIGLADRGALIQANEAFEAVSKIGLPEAALTLAHVTLYLATAAKSRAVANALGRAQKAVIEFPNEPIPLHLRNAPTKLLKELSYAKGYTWSNNFVGPNKDLPFLPEKLKHLKFFES
ncbi:AAA family ATPase [Candidatus Gottesmanbacteria bacterium RIFCSPHIGHO2_01_FULL_42_12]|uniref:AAA family ATPase n=1 Tax=Candidatus Gottesmanbacteria bacterium RIFCSPHIGHO2_01_FULL_42_12 TaxID=1798377 RepID=A0A1F5Z4S4_9BACT|nr:MAG: AAA family ATPase [Candidatus Gottesmanbacteria bacterium RIFCSPHIGHO2_01_FULL_42_12]